MRALLIADLGAPFRVRAGTYRFDQAHFGHESRALSRAHADPVQERPRQFLREHPATCLDSWPLPAD